jgi:predicted nucleic acid-binding Zn ribbon protein
MPTNEFAKRMDQMLWTRALSNQENPQYVQELKNLRLLYPDWDFIECQIRIMKEHPEWFSYLRRAKRYTKPCLVCGKEFTRYRSDAKTCSMRCAKRLSRSLLPAKSAKSPDAYRCVICDKEFTAFREAKTCSVRCRKALSRSLEGYAYDLEGSASPRPGENACVWFATFRDVPDVPTFQSSPSRSGKGRVWNVISK